MDFNDLTQIIINFSQALGPIQRLLGGFSYLLGTLLIIKSLATFHKVFESHHHSGGGESISVPFSYLIGGSVLLFFPSAFTVVSTTVFGSGNILQYASLNPITVVSAMLLLIQTVGIVWFMRGCVLLVSSSQPGAKHGPKGMVFLCAGILAMNIESTAIVMNAIIQYLASVGLSFKNQLGY